MSADNIWNEIQTVIIESAKLLIPNRKRNKSAQWMSTQTLELVDKRRKLKAKGKDPVNEKK